MKLGIDASNIRAGGGITHLTNLLAAADPRTAGITDVYVWSNAHLLARLPTRKWLHPMSEPALDGSLFRRTVWRFLRLDRRLREAGVDALLALGGIYTGRFRPFVAVCQNLLPFEPGERQRFGRSLMRLRIELVRRAQIRTFRSASGIIFNTETALGIVSEQVAFAPARATVIPFGVGRQFRREPLSEPLRKTFSPASPFRWVYVSTVNLYKHQWNVVEATADIRSEGVPATLEMLGSGYGPAVRRLERSIAKRDPNGQFAAYVGPISREHISDVYRGADGAIVASSCETPSFVLLECMAAGLPIVCSDRSSLPETLGDAGIYCDPTNPHSIAEAMKQVMTATPDERTDLGRRAHLRSLRFEWDRCASDTFAWISGLAGNREAMND
jgi:glycosyltransferase involved in cell wall biosynthesis